MSKVRSRAQASSFQASYDETLWSRSGFLARRLHQIHVAIFLTAFADEGLTPIQWGVMTVVGGHPGLNFGEIALALGIDRSNAGDVSIRLAEKGMVTLSPSKKDRRMKCVYLTKKSAKLLRENETRVKQTQDQLLRPLTMAERKMFFELLKRIVVFNNEFSRAPIKVAAE